MLLVVMLLGVAIVGCGSGGGDGGGGDQATEESGTTAEGGATGGEGATGATGGSGSAELDQAIKECRTAIDNANVSQEATDELQQICDNAASGDSGSVEDISKKVCETIIKDSVPEGAAQDQAIASCEEQSQQGN
jgi:hypothetical protein